MNCLNHFNPKTVMFMASILLLSSCTLFEPAQESKSISLVYFADIHGQLNEHVELFWDENDSKKTHMALSGGLPRMKKAIDQIREEESEVVFMDAGDTIQGSAEMAMSEGLVSVPVLNEMSIDLAIPGNWEVVYGTKALKEFSSQLNYPLIASNVFWKENNELVYRPYKIINKNGVKVAIVGYTDPDVPVRQPPSFSEEFYYKSYEILNPLIKDIKSKYNPHAVVVLSHIGLPKAVALASRLEGVDVILSSDTHERTYSPIVRDGVWVVEPGAFGSFLGKLDLEVSSSGELKKKWELIELKADKYSEDLPMKKLLSERLKPYRTELDKKVGSLQDDLARYSVLETSLDAVLADALRESTGTEIALSNGFRFARPIPKGALRERDLWNVYPINTNVKVGEISGQQLLDFWEREIENVLSSDHEKLFGGWLPRPSGMTIEFDYKAKPLSRITEVRINNEPLVKDRLYSITTCEREGDPLTTLCRIPNGKNIKVMEFDAHEAVRKYFRRHSPVASPKEKRVFAKGLPEIIRSQYYLR